MAVALTSGVTLKKLSGGSPIMVVQGRLTFSGSYATGGDPFNFANQFGFTDNSPFYVLIFGIAGFIYQYDYTNNKIFVYCNTAGGANAALGEHTAAGYAAGVSGDTVTFVAFFARG